jgi:hypothetical protein
VQKQLPYVLTAVLFTALPAWTQQVARVTVEEELRAELANLRAQIARAEALLQRLETERGAPPVPQQIETSPPEQPPVRRAPALNTPPMLPPSSTEAFRKVPPRFDILVQARGDYFADTARNDTFFLRKAELGVKGHISDNVDFSLELDPLRPNDPYRRTYIRLTHLDRLHVKLGLEKAPIGLEELTPTAQIPFVDRSEVNDRFAAAEELGVHLESHWDRWLFQLAVTNGGRRLLRDDNKQKDVTARVVWAPLDWLSLGTAVLQGQAGGDKRVRDRYNAEFKLGSHLTGFQTEFYRARDASVWSSAYYVGGFWAFPTDKRWLTHLQPVLRYERIDSGDGDREKELGLLTFGFGLLFDQHRSKFQVNYLKDLRTDARKDEVRAQYQVEF